MKIQELLNDAKVSEILQNNAPKSHYTEKPLTLVKLTGVLFQWENSMEKEWWIGSNDGVYTHQIRQAVTPAEVKVAAVAAGFDADQVEIACAVWTSEIQAQRNESANKSAADAKRVTENTPEAIRLILKRIEEKRAHDNNPNFGKKKQARLEAALEGDSTKLKFEDVSEIKLIAGSI